METVRPVFGRYELVHELAEGGMGKIYLARQSGIEGFARLCVLKRIRGDLADGDLAALLIDEARIAASLNHPNIATIYDFGRYDGELFLSMEYVAGPNLDAIIRRLAEVGEPLPREVAIHLVAEVARGLAYAHDARDAHGRPLSVVHRDISPQNVLVSIHGEVKITDFGIAKAVGKLHRSVTGEVRGKIQYMSPEQLAGATVDRRADIFALGVMLWELVLGRPLYTGRTVDEVIGTRLAGPIADPRQLDAGVSPELAAAIMGALGDLDRRTTSAAALADQLRACAVRYGAVDRDALGALVRRLFPDIDELGPGSELEAAAPGGRDDTALAPGMRIGEFEVVGVLGEGGTGVVYDAVNPMIGKRAAIKVLRGPFAADEQAVQRFLHEARAVNEINHPNIVDIFGFGTLPDGRPYCAMDRLDGETLGRALSRGALAIDEGLAILEQVATAVDAAHRRNIYHRDLKPDNVFLTADGAVKVLDFGLAKLDDPSIAATQTGIPIGTPMYMSPEQASGSQVDGRTDVYSFGVLAYRALTGQHPFSGESAVEALAARFAVAPTAPSAVGLPAELDAPILRCLALDPGERFTTTGEAVAALRAAHQKSQRRGRGRVVLLAAALVAVLGAGAATALALGGGDEPEIAAADTADAAVVAGADGGPPRLRLQPSEAPDSPNWPAAPDAAPASDPPTVPALERDKLSKRSEGGKKPASHLERRRELKRALRKRLIAELTRDCKKRGLPQMPPTAEVLVDVLGPGVASGRVIKPAVLRMCELEPFREPLITRDEMGWKPTLKLRFRSDPRKTIGAGAPSGQLVPITLPLAKQRLMQNYVDNNCALKMDGPHGVMTLTFETDDDIRVRKPRLSKPSSPSFARCVAREIASKARLAPDTRFSWRLSIAPGRAAIRRQRANR